MLPRGSLRTHNGTVKKNIVSVDVRWVRALIIFQNPVKYYKCREAPLKKRHDEAVFQQAETLAGRTIFCSPCSAREKSKTSFTGQGKIPITRKLSPRASKKSVQEGQTDMARGWLQQRVRAMDHIHKIDQQLNSVNQQIQSIELNAMTTVNTVQGLQTTRETLAAVQISAGPDRISNLADAAAELMEETEECADAVGLSSISHSSALQEESIDEQLKSLMLGSIDLPTVTAPEPAPVPAPAPILSHVPSMAEPQKPEKRIEDELLQWANS